MKIQDFELLSYEHKKLYIWTKGTFLVTYNEGSDLFDAYELFDFYVVLRYTYHGYAKAAVITANYPDELPHLQKLNKSAE